MISSQLNPIGHCAAVVDGQVVKDGGRCAAKGLSGASVECDGACSSIECAIVAPVAGEGDGLCIARESRSTADDRIPFDYNAGVEIHGRCAGTVDRQVWENTGIASRTDLKAGCSDC